MVALALLVHREEFGVGLEVLQGRGQVADVSVAHHRIEPMEIEAVLLAPLGINFPLLARHRHPARRIDVAHGEIRAGHDVKIGHGDRFLLGHDLAPFVGEVPAAAQTFEQGVRRVESTLVVAVVVAADDEVPANSLERVPLLLEDVRANRRVVARRDLHAGLSCRLGLAYQQADGIALHSRAFLDKGKLGAAHLLDVCL